MGIKLGCPKCGKDFDVHPALAGQPLDCSDCGNTFIVPSSAPAVESNDRDPSRKKVSKVPCPKCGAQHIVEGAPSKIEIECESCGHRFTKSKRKKRKAASALPVGQKAGNSPKAVPAQPKPQSGSPFGVGVLIGGLVVLLFLGVGLFLRERSTPSNPGIHGIINRKFSISVTVHNDVDLFNWIKNTRIGKHPVRYELYKNDEIVRTELEDNRYIKFENVMVKKSDTLRAKAHWQNGMGALIRTYSSDEITIDSDQDLIILCKRF